MELDETDIQKRKRHGDTLWPVGILGPGAHIDIIMGMEARMNGPALNTLTCRQPGTNRNIQANL